MTPTNTTPYVQLPVGYKQEERALKVLVSFARIASNFSRVYDFQGYPVSAIVSHDFRNVARQIVKELKQQP